MSVILGGMCLNWKLVYESLGSGFATKECEFRFCFLLQDEWIGQALSRVYEL